MIFRLFTLYCPLLYHRMWMIDWSRGIRLRLTFVEGCVCLGNVGYAFEDSGWLDG